MVRVETYEQVVLDDPDGNWELADGRLRRKPTMTTEHNVTMSNIARMLYRTLNPAAYDVRVNSGRTRRATVSYYVPDIFVVPRATVSSSLSRPRAVESYADPLPLIIEVWSPSTGDYDVDSKLPEYQRRGDLEIWRVHPYERTVTVWRKQPDGSYVETLYREGVVIAAFLPDVSVDLAAVFA